LQRDFGEEEENEQEKDDFSRGASFTQSRRPSSKPASYQASFAGTHKGKLKAFALGLEAKEISVLYIDIFNLDELLLTYSPNDVVNQHGRLLTEIFKLAARSKGDISFFNQKKFVVTWNASTRSRHHALEACSTAVQVREVVQKLTQQLQQLHQFSKPMHVVIGVATGLSYAGNIGTQSKRQFATFGTAQNLVEHITSLSTEWNNAILIPSATAEYVKKKFNVRPLDYVRIKDSPKTIEDRIYELFDRKAEHADDEWMYSMEKEKQENKFAKVAEGFEARLHSEYDKAISLLEEYLEKNPNDRNVEKLKELCEKWKSEGNEGLVVHTKQENAWEYKYDN
jgi:adenylate cyclase